MQMEKKINLGQSAIIDLFRQRLLSLPLQITYTLL